MPTCFAIGAIGTARVPDDATADTMRQRSATFYEDVVRPVCEQLDLSLIRADNLPSAGPLSERLIRHLVEEDIVVADLTGGHPEIIYGLGIRRALGRCTVHLAEAGAVPLGPDVVPIIEFPALPRGSAQARQILNSALAKALSGASPLLPPAAIAPSDAPSPPAEDDPEQAAPAEDGPGLFELAVAAETEMEAIAEDMAEVEAAFQDLAAMAELSSEDMLRVTLPGSSMSAQLAVLHRFAKSIEGPSDDLEAAALRLTRRMNVAVDALGAFLRWARDTPRSEWPNEVDGLLDLVIETAQEIRSATAGMEGMEPAMATVGTASRKLRKPIRKVGASVQAIFQSVAVFEEWEGTARKLKQG